MKQRTTPYINSTNLNELHCSPSELKAAIRWCETQERAGVNWQAAVEQAPDHLIPTLTKLIRRLQLKGVL